MGRSTTKRTVSSRLLDHVSRPEFRVGAELCIFPQAIASRGDLNSQILHAMLRAVILPLQVPNALNFLQL